MNYKETKALVKEIIIVMIFIIGSHACIKKKKERFNFQFINPFPSKPAL